MFAVVEHDFEHPTGAVDVRRRQDTWPRAVVTDQRRPVAIKDVLEVPVGRATDVAPRPAVVLARVFFADTVTVLSLVAIDGGVTSVVAGLADQPGKNMAGIQGIGNPRRCVRAFGLSVPVEGEHVVFRDRAPMHIAWCAKPRPLFDAGEQALDPWSISTYAIAIDFVLVDYQAAGRVAHPEPVVVSLEAGMCADPRPVGILAIDRHEIFRPGDDVDVRVIGVVVPRQSSVGLARDRGH